MAKPLKLLMMFRPLTAPPPQTKPNYCGFSTHEPSGIKKHVKRDEIMWKIELGFTFEFHLSQTTVVTIVL